MLVTNNMTHDSRVARHAGTLGSAGYEITVVCELTGGLSWTEKREGYNVVRAQSKIAEHAASLDRRLGSSDVQQQRFLTRRKDLNWIARFILRVVRIVLLQRALLKEARKTGAHIYCANDLDTLLLAILAAGSESRVIYDSHELWPDMLVAVPGFLKRMLQSYEGVLVRLVDTVMTVNEFIAQELANRYEVRHPVRVIYNCVPLPKGTVKKAREREIKAADVVLYHGWYSRERGLENVVKASELLSPGVTLLFRGAGELEGDLKKLASGRNNVRFERPVAQADVVDAASLADVGIVPYLPTNLCNYYASPNKLFEYMAAGLPIAASNLPFMRKVVMENSIGTLFDAGDPRSIAAAINLITRPSDLKRYKKNVVLARKKYNWEVESQKLLEVYEQLSGKDRHFA